MHEINFHNFIYIKYTRFHLLNIFNILHNRKEFIYNINHCSKKRIPQFIQHKRRLKLNINQNSNDFFNDSNDIRNKKNENKLKINKNEFKRNNKNKFKRNNENE